MLDPNWPFVKLAGEGELGRLVSNPGPTDSVLDNSIISISTDSSDCQIIEGSIVSVSSEAESNNSTTPPLPVSSNRSQLAKNSKTCYVQLERMSAETVKSLTTGPTTARSMNATSTFAFRHFVKETVRNSIQDVKFNHHLGPGQPKIFASVAKNRISLYECTSAGKIKLVQCYEDPDENEDFFTCCWSVDAATKRSILIAGGARGIIRVLYPEENVLNKSFIGHGSQILDLKSSAKKPFLLASASRDRSFRLWNLQTNVQIANFHGLDAHREDVISIDFNGDCSKIITSGTDHKIIIWDLMTPEISSAIETSKSFKGITETFKTAYHPFAEFATRDVHNTYVDCVQWFGDLVISKALEDDLVCWKPDLTTSTSGRVKGNYSIVHEFRGIQRCIYYYTRFALNQNHTALALGNSKGEVKVWDLDVPDPSKIKAQNLKKHKRCNSNVRHISFSRCGQTLIFCCDDGTIWRYDRSN